MKEPGMTAMFFRCVRPVFCCLWLLLGMESAHAACPAGPGSSVSVTYHDTFTTDTYEVFDGDPQDLDPLPRAVIAHFEFGAAAPPPQDWVATGTVKAVSYPDGYANTLLTDVLIENVGGPVDDVQIIARHCFDNQITVPMSFKAPVDGAILNTLDGIIDARAELEYAARVNDVGLSGAFTATGLGLGPFPFNHLLGPTEIQMLPPRASQSHWLRFYLDGTGDAIRLDNSALIEPDTAGVPVGSVSSILSVAGLLLASGLGVRACRQR